jgi:hypothetical protein
MSCKCFSCADYDAVGGTCDYLWQTGKRYVYDMSDADLDKCHCYFPIDDDDNDDDSVNKSTFTGC